MTVQEAIAAAESMLPGRAAPDGELDPRWQAIIAVGEFVEEEPEAVWQFILRWGSSSDEDLRAAVATCLLEHLLEHHFDRFITRIERAAKTDPLFAKTAASCWKFGQSEEPNRSARFDQLVKQICNARASTLRYVELKTGYHDDGPAWIGYVSASRSARTIYFNGQAFRRSSRGTSGNYYDLETGSEYWISGVKRRGGDRHWAGSGKITIEAAAVEEYLAVTGAKELDRSRFVVSHTIRPTDVSKFHDAENRRPRTRD